MPDSESEIERICQAVLDCPPEARAELLLHGCGGDESMRREVEGLLAFEATAHGFMEAAALALPSRLGPYEIRSILGTGGMGDVYRARDTVLDRDVALKVLPRSLAADPERLARFQREAKVLASLNHPNIAQIYGVEQDALVMELVDGETLKGPLTVSTALDYAGQIAAALEAAHERGVVHRDLKPANVMTTARGVVKVLDFGLAAVEHDLSRDDPRAADEAPGPVNTTRAGAIMGTAAYMSPEQASGHPVDKRADIWSFGAVFWELLTGRALFEADTVSETLSNVTTAPIDWQRLPGETPTAIRDLLARCLDRDARTRLRDIGEARIQIQRSLAATPQSASAFSRQRLARAVTWVSIGLAVVFAALFVTERRAARPPELREPMTIPHPGSSAGDGGRRPSALSRRTSRRIHRQECGRPSPHLDTFVEFGGGASAAGHGGRVQPAVLVSRQPLRWVRGGHDIEEGGRRRRPSRYAVRSVRTGIDRQPGVSRRVVERHRRHRVCHLEQRALAHSRHWRRSGSRDSRRRLRISRLSSGWRTSSVYLVRARPAARRVRRGTRVSRTAACEAAGRRTIRVEHVRAVAPAGRGIPPRIARRDTLGTAVRRQVPDIERRASVGCGRCTRHEPAFGVLHVIDGGARVQHVDSGGHFTAVVVRPHGQAVRPARTTIVRFEHQYLVRWQPDRIRSLGVGSTYAPHLECRSGTWRTDAVE